MVFDEPITPPPSNKPHHTSPHLKGRQLPGDGQLAVAREDLLLQRPLRAHETARQRTGDIVAVLCRWELGGDQCQV
jgi:hypothetical protein